MALIPSTRDAFPCPAISLGAKTNYETSPLRNSVCTTASLSTATSSGTLRRTIQQAGRSAAWLARLLWEQEVASSNLAAPTTITFCDDPCALRHGGDRDRRDRCLATVRALSIHRSLETQRVSRHGVRLPDVVRRPLRPPLATTTTGEGGVHREGRRTAASSVRRRAVPGPGSARRTIGWRDAPPAAASGRDTTRFHTERRSVPDIPRATTALAGRAECRRASEIHSGRCRCAARRRRLGWPRSAAHRAWRSPDRCRA